MYKLSGWEAYRMDIFKCWWEVSMLSEYFRYLRLWFSGARRVRAQWGLSPYFFLQLFCYSQPVAEQPIVLRTNELGKLRESVHGDQIFHGYGIREGGRGKCKYYSLISMPIFFSKDLESVPWINYQLPLIIWSFSWECYTATTECMTGFRYSF